jgi:hypothetical protein
MNEVLARVMSRPNAPNLYWALMQMPAGAACFATQCTSSGGFSCPAFRIFPRRSKGAQLTPEEWHVILNYMAELQAIDPGEGGKKRVTDPVKAATPENLKQARELYAKQHKLKPEQVEKLDPVRRARELLCPPG